MSNQKNINNLDEIDVKNNSLDLDDHIVEKSVLLSLVEIVLGSFMHTVKIPFSGHVLSLNQGLFLSRSFNYVQRRGHAAKIVIEISLVTSVMKSLSPAGKKLGPMISISMQGFFYSIGLLIFGANLMGQMLGMILLSL